MREIATVRVRYGYRKILVLLQREGWAVGKTMISRLYREEGLVLRRTVPRKRRVAVERRERPKATGPNQAWSLDFVTDQLADGRRFRALTVMDVHTRESLAIEPGQSLKGQDVVRVLQGLQKDRGGMPGRSSRLGEGSTMRVVLTGPWGRGAPHEFALQMAASCHLKGMQSPQDSP